MPTQLHLPVQPAGAQEINAVVAMVEREQQVAYFASGVPLFVHRSDDPVARQVAAAQKRVGELLKAGQSTLRIRLHSLANPRGNQALAHVCATLNALELQYPGTSLTLVYEVPGVA